MPDSTYTTPFYLSGDMVASMTGNPSNIGNPGDANFAMQLTGVEALGTSSDNYRLVWHQNTNTTDTTFSNGQGWRLEVHTPGSDNNADPFDSDSGWSTVPGYGNLTPGHDQVAGLGGGDDYITFFGTNRLLVDLDGGLPTTPTDLQYTYDDENGDPNVGDEDRELDFNEIYETGPNPICFSKGTLIETDQGLIAVEALKTGDMIKTRDRGLQSLRWIGSQIVGIPNLIAAEYLKPICIKSGALGDNKPFQDLYVSPQHRILVRSKISERMFGENEILVAAKHLLAVAGIERFEKLVQVEYFHLMFDAHEIIYANGIEAESLLTGPQAMKSLSAAALEEIQTLFPELDLANDAAAERAARQLANGRRGRQLAERHVKNDMCLQEA